MLPSNLARITNGSRYCSGVLCTPDTVLTCAHFFRDVSGTTFIWIRGKRLVYKELKIIPGTDVAVLTLPTRISIAPDELPTFGPSPLPGALTATFGLGGTTRSNSHFRVRHGRFFMRVPFAMSRDRKTKVRPAGWIFNHNAAVLGDSGGPVYSNGKLFAVQSMIMAPGGVNTHVATVALVDEAMIR
ncbi:trypsin-like peptidase domain-containing protein [Corynebacterium breve]|uniref:Trypsin-like peptidase domain-containing protein n=1 Tax=Corynebacterium breve TaxID=3049799 RepID=A0ABY8VHM7_9CORY|nr:trypsin-like peptidase domain-containing protein [Corynebacterium breve]WIM68832.1 trypsin-like peptidase domain-containing protein [Corynebacterium breve]